ALGFIQLAGAHTGVFRNAGRLAPAVAQVIELGAAHLAAAHDLHTFHHRRIDREHALHAFAVGNLADREILLEARAGTRDHHALIGLHAGARTFGDANQNAHRIAGLEFGKRALRFDLGSLFGFDLTDDIHRCNLFLLLNSQ